MFLFFKLEMESEYSTFRFTVNMLKALVCILIASSLTDYTRLNRFVKSKAIKQ